MEKIGMIDVKIISLGIKNKDRIDESTLEKSELEKSGTGRLLDSLASLIDRKLLRLNDDKSFQITNNAKQILWNKEIPLWVKILRILEIKSLKVEKISEYLDIEEEEIRNEIEKLRKNQLIMMSALRTEKELEQIFEILPEGLEELEKIKTKGYGHANPKLREASNIEIFELLSIIIKEIKESNLDESTKNGILKKISLIQTKLNI